jgi:hypothetical protein
MALVVLTRQWFGQPMRGFSAHRLGASLSAFDLSGGQRSPAGD